MTALPPGPLNPTRITPGGVHQPGLGGISVPNSSGGNTTLLPPTYTCQAVPLDNVFVNQEIDFTGTVLMAIYATINTALIYVRFDSQSAAPIPFYAPLSIRGFPFSKIYLSNPTAQAGQSITLFAALDKNTTLPIET